MIWLLMALSLRAQANTVLLQGPRAMPLEYKAMLKAHSNLVSPTQEYLNTHPALAGREHLLALFSEAQKAFLEKSNEEARAKFVAVIELLPQDDWEKSDREVFFQSYLRLAQMETAAAARDRWLGQSLLLGEVNYDSTLFPPPLLARRTELAQRLPKKEVSKHLLALGWEHILLNGQMCKKGDCGAWTLYPGLVRVTVLSDQWQPQTAVTDLAEIDHLTPNKITWAEGACDNEQLSAEANRFADKKVFWGLSCEKPEAAAVNLKLAAMIPQPLPLFTTAAPKSAPIYESKWFWAGVAAVVGVIVIASAKTKETKQTTTTYGN